MCFFNAVHYNARHVLLCTAVDHLAPIVLMQQGDIFKRMGLQHITPHIGVRDAKLTMLSYNLILMTSVPMPAKSPCIYLRFADTEPQHPFLPANNSTTAQHVPAPPCHFYRDMLRRVETEPGASGLSPLSVYPQCVFLGEGEGKGGAHLWTKRKRKAKHWGVHHPHHYTILPMWQPFPRGPTSKCILYFFYL